MTYHEADRYLFAKTQAVVPASLQWPQQLNAGLEEVDPELFDIIEKEKNRQWKVRGSHGAGPVLLPVWPVWKCSAT